MFFEKKLHDIGLYFVKSYAKAMLKVDVKNGDNMPAGPAIIVANHPTTTDPFLIPTLSSGHVKVLIHQTLFNIPLFGAYLYLSGHIPVIPGKGHLAFEKAEAAIKSGDSLAVFIEGGLSPHIGGFHPPRTGAARLALATGAPVIPVGIHLIKDNVSYTKKDVKNDEVEIAWYKHGHYAMTVGKPLYFSGNAKDRDNIKNITQEIMNHVIELSEQSSKRISS